MKLRFRSSFFHACFKACCHSYCSISWLSMFAFSLKTYSPFFRKLTNSTSNWGKETKLCVFIMSYLDEVYFIPLYHTSAFSSHLFFKIEELENN